jgi:hypothetical protein
LIVSYVLTTVEPPIASNIFTKPKIQKRGFCPQKIPFDPRIVRKYYADLLAKRKPATATTPAVPIPPMAT